MIKRKATMAQRYFTPCDDHLFILEEEYPLWVEIQEYLKQRRDRYLNKEMQSLQHKIWDARHHLLMTCDACSMLTRATIFYEIEIALTKPPKVRYPSSWWYEDGRMAAYICDDPIHKTKKQLELCCWLVKLQKWGEAMQG